MKKKNRKQSGDGEWFGDFDGSRNKQRVNGCFGGSSNEGTGTGRKLGRKREHSLLAKLKRRLKKKWRTQR